MMPSEYGSSAPTSAKSSAQQVRDDETAALVQLRALERAGEQLQLRELHRLVDVLEDTLHVGARRDELGRQLERLRRRVRVLEPPRVRDEPDVERLRDLGRQRDVELTQDVAHDLGRRRRAVVDQHDVAETVVVVMVVDVDHQLGALDAGLGLADAALVGTVDGDEHALAEVIGQRAREPVELEEGVLGGQRRRARQVHRRLLAQRAQAERRREHRSEGVAVGVLVRDDDEAVVARGSPPRRRRGQCSSSGASSAGGGNSPVTSSISFVM